MLFKFDRCVNFEHINFKVTIISRLQVLESAVENACKNTTNFYNIQY